MISHECVFPSFLWLACSGTPSSWMETDHSDQHVPHSDPGKSFENFHSLHALLYGSLSFHSTFVLAGTNGDHHGQRMPTPTTDDFAAQASPGEGKEAAERRHEEGREYHQEGPLGEASRPREEADGSR